MALGKDIQLSNAEREVAYFIVDNIPSGALISFAKSSASFKNGGFRSDKPQIIKSFLKKEIDSAQVADPAVREFLASNCECACITKLLSQAALSDCARAFEILYTKQVFRIARLLDSRESVRDKAAKEPSAEEKKDYSEEDAKWARNNISELLGQLLGAFAPSAAADSGDVPQPAGATNFQTKKELAQLRAEAKRLRGAQTKIAQQEERIANDAETIRQLAARAENAEQALGQMRNRAENAEAAVERYRKNIDDYTNAAVESRLAEEFSNWLGGKRLEQIRAAYADGLAADTSEPPQKNGLQAVFDQAQAALRLQADADIASGVRDVLVSRLEKTEALLEKCLAAQKNAITVVPELGKAIAGLLAEKTRLTKVLGIQDTESATTLPPEDALDTAISQADDKQLPDITHTANRLLKMGVLSEEAHTRITRKIGARYEAYYDKRSVTVLDSGDKASPEEILELGKQGKVPVVLLVDGHNVLFSLTSRYCRAQDHRGPSSEARQWLIDDLCQIFGNSPAVRVKLVFDGNEYSYAAAADNIDVEYSGGGTAEVEHRADNVLAQAARSHRESGCASHLLIVTNDNGLANRVISCGGHSLPPTVLLKWL